MVGWGVGITRKIERLPNTLTKAMFVLIVDFGSSGTGIPLTQL